MPLTSYPGMEDQPSFSPDGNQVAFEWNGEKQDNDDIYVKLIGSGGWLRLTSDPARDYSPAWSPDGSSIAFLRDLPGGRTAVRLVPPIGGSERKLAETTTSMGLPSASMGLLSCLAWTPDGSSLAIVDRNSPEQPFRVFLLSVETGQKRKLTSPPRDADDFFPAFSPDGRALAFVRFRASASVADLLIEQLASNLSPVGEPKTVPSAQPGGLQSNLDTRWPRDYLCIRNGLQSSRFVEDRSGWFRKPAASRFRWSSK